MSFTDPATLPDDIKIKLLAIREALISDDIEEAYYQLYSIADPNFENHKPWESLQQGDPADTEIQCRFCEGVVFFAEYDFCPKCGREICAA